jgi:hypothetical protein
LSMPLVIFCAVLSCSLYTAIFPDNFISILPSHFNVTQCDISSKIFSFKSFFLGYNAMQSVESDSYLWARRRSQARHQHWYLFRAGILLVLFFNPEVGGDMFLRNVGWLSTDYTALYPKRYNSS